MTTSKSSEMAMTKDLPFEVSNGYSCLSFIYSLWEREVSHTINVVTVNLKHLSENQTEQANS